MRGRPKKDLLSIIVPCYNERGTLKTIVARVVAAELPVPRLEILLVDDGSVDGTGDLCDELALRPADAMAKDLRCLGVEDAEAALRDVEIRALHHDRNRGKSAAVRTGIDAVRGSITLIQDADLEYDPADLPRLLEPILSRRADVVFGTRFQGPSRRVLYFWHTVGNRVLTTVSNALSDLNLTDVECGYKAFRPDLLVALELESDEFGFEVEVIAKVARLNARIYEVPVSYAGRSYAEGKKVRWWHGVQALRDVARFGLGGGRALKPEEAQAEVLEDLSTVTTLTDHMYRTFRPMLGRRILEIGAGNGNLTAFLLQHGDVMATDVSDKALDRLRSRFGNRGSLEVARWDVTEPFGLVRSFDTVVFVNVLEHIEDDGEALRNVRDVLEPGGRMILLVPQGMWLYGPFDSKIGHHRRYARENLSKLLAEQGFELKRLLYFNALGVPGWWVNAKLLGRDHISLRMLRLYNRVAGPLLWAERRVGVPLGLSLVAEAAVPE